jgi:transposase-like protein
MENGATRTQHRDQPNVDPLSPVLPNEEAAYAFVEARIWPRGPVCPHCGGVERNKKMQGKSTRIGVYKCYDCRKPFTVKIGTNFEASHIPMNVWLQAIFLVASSKKGMSSNQLHRSLGISLKSARFMSHRIRDAMRTGSFAPFGNHLQRYLAEFDFRYNNRVANGVNDAQRADLLLKGAVGKRLTYETTAQ